MIIFSLSFSTLNSQLSTLNYWLSLVSGLIFVALWVIEFTFKVIELRLIFTHFILLLNHKSIAYRTYIFNRTSVTDCKNNHIFNLFIIRAFQKQHICVNMHAHDYNVNKRNQVYIVLVVIMTAGIK